MPIEFLIVVVIVVLVSLFFFISAIRTKKKKIHYYRESLGQLNTHKITGDHLEKCKFYAHHSKGNGAFYIDEITANDCSLDDFYNLINDSVSQIGHEYCYASLLRPLLNQKEIRQRIELANHFYSKEEVTIKTKLALSKIRNLPYYVSFYEQLLFLKKEKKKYLHHFLLGFLILSIILSIFVINIGAPLLSLSLILNSMVYLGKEVSTASNLNSFNTVVTASQALETIVKLNPEVLDDAVLKSVKLFKYGGFVQEDMNTSEFNSITKLIFMLTHIDFVYYNEMLNRLQKHFDDILALFKQIGEIELALTISNLWLSDLNTCIPTFKQEEPLIINQMIHPLVNNCVANDVMIDRSLLITGSNASGKSTYIKALALNIISAQSLVTSFSNSYQGPFYKVLSSMALSDNLEGEESYFMVELKSLNRIVNMDQSDVRVIGFIDEILRGTNTIERIAASSAVLQQMSVNDKRFVAATHDIELTKILENEINNYHFTENLDGDDIEFDYLIKEGPSQSRNAIKLLEVNGYDSKIIEQANHLIRKFEQKGRWN